MVDNFVATFVGHNCPVGGPVLFHWACDGIGHQQILNCCPAKHVYGPVKFFTWPVKYYTRRVEISLGNKATSKTYFHWPSENVHHNLWPSTLPLLPRKIFHWATIIFLLSSLFYSYNIATTSRRFLEFANKFQWHHKIASVRKGHY